ncbi:MAG: hypothetical protein MZW92_21265 [Comamonadaceae bacterium]|nr:hypothetical protein [Comamonadaceae bacterium]
MRRGTNLVGEPGAVLMRRQTMTRVGRFDAADPYVIDLDYWLRMLATGDAWYCDEPLAGFRISAGQWSVRIEGHQARDMRRMVGRLRDARRSRNRPDGPAARRGHAVLEQPGAAGVLPAAAAHRGQPCPSGSSTESATQPSRSGAAAARCGV